MTRGLAGSVVEVDPLAKTSNVSQQAAFTWDALYENQEFRSRKFEAKISSGWPAQTIGANVPLTFAATGGPSASSAIAIFNGGRSR
jgi:hypothetical protein